MKLNKFLAALAVGTALFSGIAFQNTVEASYGVMDMGSISKNKKLEANKNTPVKTMRPSSTSVNSGFNYVNWSLQGTMTREKMAVKGAAIYVVEYDDGTEVPKYHMDGDTMIFDNVSKGQLISVTKDTGDFISLDFRAPARINVIVFAPAVGVRYFSVDKKTYLGRYDFDFGPMDDTKSAMYHNGIIR